MHVSKDTPLCVVCHQVFEDSGTLEEHMKVAHTKTADGVKPHFDCSYCNKVFASAATLRSHESQHKQRGDRGLVEKARKRLMAPLCCTMGQIK